MGDPSEAASPKEFGGFSEQCTIKYNVVKANWLVQHPIEYQNSAAQSELNAMVGQLKFWIVFLPLATDV